MGGELRVCSGVVVGGRPVTSVYWSQRNAGGCPLCRDSFDKVTPFYGIPILEILPLIKPCTILPDFEVIEIDPLDFIFEVQNLPNVDNNEHSQVAGELRVCSGVVAGDRRVTSVQWSSSWWQASYECVV